MLPPLRLGRRQAFAIWALLAGLLSSALLAQPAVPPRPAGWPAEALLQAGQRVLLLGDSIIGPGMYGLAANSLLDRQYPEAGVTFHSYGQAGTTVATILPLLAKPLANQQYDWILLNFGHNDAGKLAPEQFTAEARTLLARLRELAPGARLGWLSVLGSEPSPFGGEPTLAKRQQALLASRAKHAAIAAATRELCAVERIAYLPLHEFYSELLAQRERQGLKVCFTMDGSHPNLLGNWLIGAALLQTLGLTPPPMTVDLPQAESHSDMSRLPVTWLAEPQLIRFDGLFLSVRLLPPPVTRVACKMLPAPLTLDGQLDDWPATATLLAANAPQHVTWELAPRQARHFAATMRTARDATHLYFGCTVTAPTVTEGEHFPEIVELFLDARADRERSGNVWQRTKGLTQYAIHRDFSATATLGHATVAANGDPSQATGVRAVATRTATGYTLEIAIPLANFSQVKLAAGSELPWHWALSASDQTVNLDWLGLMSRTQSTRGYTTLVLE